MDEEEIIRLFSFNYAKGLDKIRIVLRDETLKPGLENLIRAIHASNYPLLHNAFLNYKDCLSRRFAMEFGSNEVGHASRVLERTGSYLFKDLSDIEDGIRKNPYDKCKAYLLIQLNILKLYDVFFKR